MSGQYWQRLEDLFAQACDVPASARDAFIAGRCADDPTLRDELAALLRAHDAAAEFLESPRFQADAITVEAPGLLAGSRFGAWRVVRAIGRGGMGEVYEVSRAVGGFEQRAALKLLRHEAAAQTERFHAERSILARLDHPGIARLLDGGVADDGRPWAALEYVEGQTITAWCETHRADVNRRLELFLQACAAVAYAHRNLIVHRDLKPSNILVDERGRVRLLDFGIAKLLDPALGRSSDTTQMMLTPDYCAPEQLVGEPVTTATDVYVLGLLLYELLTGAKASPVQGLPIMRAMLALVDPDTPKPSATALSLADAPVPARLLRGDLDAIVARTLRKEPAHRYATVDALHADVERHLRGQPVAARSGARLYVFGRFLRRYRWVVAGVAALILALGAGLAGTVWQARRAEAQAARAEREARTATAVQDFLRDIFRANSSAQSDPVKARATTARQLLNLGADKIDTAMADAPEAKLGVLQLLGGLYKDLAMRDERIRVLRQSVALARDHYAVDAPELAAALVDLADAMYGSSENPESESLLREAQAILDRRRDDRSALRGRLLVAQAQYYRFVDPSLADDAVDRAVRLYEALPPSRGLADALQLQGGAEWIDGDRAAAIASMKRVIEVLSALPEERFGLVNAYSDLATLQYEVVDVTGAEKNARLALATALAINGEQHVGTILEKTWLGGTLFALGHVREGLDLHAQAKRQVLALPGAENQTEIASVLENRGGDLAEAGDLEAGLDDLDAALAIRRRGPRNLVLATLLDNTSVVLAELGRYDAARKDSQEAAGIRAAAGGTLAPTAVVDMRVVLPLRQGRFADARRALDGYAVSNVSGQRLSRSAIQRWLYAAEIAVRSGDVDGVAEPVANVREAIRSAGLGDSFKGALASADLFDGMAKLAGRDAAGALPLLRHALLLREELFLPTSPKIAEAQIELARCQLALGRVAQARELAAQAQAIHARHKELGEHYREPLRRLLRQLSAPARS
ncbi:serine/threonine-protein kinase [Dokdonella sp.]|uniref:serine/threonine-protein kinase n=1 Tax=Dokdonella sp. TaxID=2291710 RepID=UPI001B2A7260|nr:serine/threonine-protein kinase [Dokdonella sp.]MBO9662800.1 serine/threonine protein kinase [Dokdonella sp.]